ncbi:hypothetical protein CBR_g40421 [Chara braunii]|nr:hypothetical protein CBR_g40421 [Chara braunii]|eukprot:GBG85690.1 hypothetical protein CBR_g40421 [Chara braunii]
MVSTMRPRPVLKRSAPTVVMQTRMRRPNEQLQKERESEKAVEEEPIPVSENDEDNEDEKLRAEEEERARRRALEREPQKGKAEANEEESRKNKNIYSIPVEHGVDIEQLVDKILESQRDLVTLKKILAVSPKIQEEFKQRMTRKRVMTVKLGEVIPPEANWSPPGTKMDWRSVSTGYMKVQIGQQEYSALVDDGAEMNIIRERHAIEAGLKINRDDYGFWVGASGSTPFCGTASGVLVTIGKVKVRSYFYVLPRVEHEVLLGRAFLCRSESIIINKHDGIMFVILCDPVCGHYEVVKCANTGPYCSRNRLNPESYSFPELEKLRREKESLGEEPNAREFSLTLPNIGQAIDFVSTRAAIDPNVMQALTEIITDTGSVGTMRLVYSPSEENKGENQELPSTRQGPFLEDAGLTPAPNDLQKLNSVTVRDAGGLPHADLLSESCAGRSIIILIDLYSGYDQFLIYTADRPKMAMYTPRGLIHMCVAPQGWTNVVAIVQRYMTRVMQPYCPNITSPYIDYLAIPGSHTKDLAEVLPSIRRFVWEHINDVVKVLKRLKEFNLTASGIKSRHCMKRAVILGFLCDEKGRRPDAKKTNKILEWPTPFKSITDVRSFLGTCGFWRIFIRRFAARVEHLRKLVRKGQKWGWGPKQQAVVEDIKTEFREGGLILGVPFFDDDEKRPFLIETDVGPTALGGVLIQKDAEGQEMPLRFESRTLNVAERNYSQFKKETLVVLHCFRIFRNYVFGRRFILRVDPTALAQSLRNYSPADPTIARWLTYIWMFDFEIERISRSQNRADGLSRVEWDPEADQAEESVPVNAFLKEKEARLSINIFVYLTDAATRHGKSIWNAPAFHEVRPELVVEEPFIKEDPWGEQTAEEMMRLALTGDIDLMFDPVTIEQGHTRADGAFQIVGRMSYIMNLLVHEDHLRLMNAEEGGGELKEVFKKKEYEGEYKKIGNVVEWGIGRK